MKGSSFKSRTDCLLMSSSSHSTFSEVQMESQVIERFFKPMVPDFRTTLRLPPIISRKVAEANMEEAILISSKGEWTVNIGQNRDGLVCFEKGWDSFVKGRGLNIGDFAVFEHVGNLHFKVSLFGSSTCEKDFSGARQKEEAHLGPNVFEQIKITKRGRPTKAVLESYHKDHPHFTRKITAYHLNHPIPPMHIPLHFSRQNDLAGKSSMILKCPSGEFVPVELKVNAEGRVCMSTRGWYEFCTSNKIKEGDVCLFELGQALPGSNAVAIDVQVFRAPTGRFAI